MSAPLDSTPITTASTSMPTTENGTTPSILMADPMKYIINVSSVKTHILITLNVSSSNYSQWSTLFNVFIGKSILDMAEKSEQHNLDIFCHYQQQLHDIDGGAHRW
ncbi:hypothetical protein GUJ93_ZPchr0002g26217 [Zizania palustris]|uniref:Uncharacterized protein n=1 Tax=Zizania palustris TaxID=103762 RepID=A0A8J5SR90_ZIZPA|nr:hypothetical protein GUJ93_ZPchr0002g26217 [Zizania palustris]